MPTKSDARFKKLLTDHILNAKGFYDYGIDRKLVIPDDIRHAIEKKRALADAVRSVKGGSSVKKAAKDANVPRSTLRDQLAAQRSGGNRHTGVAETATRALLAQSDQNDWRTPRKYLDAARAVMGAIDLDPASSVEANKTVKAEKYYTDKDNGLEKPWSGRVWLNPPYGGEARLFIERLVREYEVGNVTAACALLNSHPTETKWFQKLFDHTICFIAGRIDFGGPSREVSTTSTHGSAIAYLGQDAAKFAAKFSTLGAVVRKL